MKAVQNMFLSPGRQKGRTGDIQNPQTSFFRSSYLLHLYGRSTMTPGTVAFTSTLKAARMTAVWVSTLPGSPSGCPIGHLTNTDLGGRTSSVNRLAMLTPTVGIPSLSIALCISPTDRLQRPQPGVSNTASTLALFNNPAT